MVDFNDTALAFIGGGQMAQALIGGLIAGGHAPATVSVSDPDAGQRAALARLFPGIQIYADNGSAATGAATWILAVKPQLMAQVADGLAPQVLTHRPLVVSVAAGVRLIDLASWLGDQARLVRAMPNRPALVGAGITALYADPTRSRAERDSAEAIFAAVGRTLWLAQETQMDAVTAVSGSGPAYFFLLTELIEAAAVERGIPQALARVLSVETAWGAAQMARRSGLEPATLRAQVTSPGGTTAAALSVFEAAHLRAIVSRAVAAATERAAELAREQSSGRQ
jgi:pyrroline-5-carboxylate reductase